MDGRLGVVGITLVRRGRKARVLDGVLVKGVVSRWGVALTLQIQ